jgi:uncharacterized cupredoxin-like copper-binding protein
MRFRLRFVIALLAAIAVTLAGYAINSTTRADAATALGPGLVTVHVDIHDSAFSISTLHVQPGTLVRFLIRNDDPIDHEFILGDAAVHAAHERGKALVHPPVPGEVSLLPGQLGETFYKFDQPARYLFACHFPGHLAYGMKGWVIVDAV